MGLGLGFEMGLGSGLGGVRQLTLFIKAHSKCRTVENSFNTCSFDYVELELRQVEIRFNRIRFC